MDTYCTNHRQQLERSYYYCKISIYAIRQCRSRRSMLHLTESFKNQSTYSFIFVSTYAVDCKYEMMFCDVRLLHTFKSMDESNTDDMWLFVPSESQNEFLEYVDHPSATKVDAPLVNHPSVVLVLDILLDPIPRHVLVVWYRKKRDPPPTIHTHTGWRI